MLNLSGMYVRINFSVWHVLKPKICIVFLISPKVFVGKITEYTAIMVTKIAGPTLVQYTSTVSTVVSKGTVSHSEGKIVLYS